MEEKAEFDRIEELLESKMEYWSFSGLLHKVYRGTESVQKRLSDKLSEYDGEKNRAAVERKVRNWLHDRNIPQKREELFKICFALELDEEKTNSVLGVTAENGIHYRNPREVIYAYCLRSGRDYPEAQRLEEKLWKKKYGDLPDRRNLTESKKEELPMTFSVRNDFKRVQTEKELEAFLEKRRESFGYFRNTAYRKFTKMLSCLSVPEESWQYGMPREQDYSVDQIVNHYLRMGVPYDKKSEKYSRAAKQIKKKWPSPKSVREILSGRQDVDRKSLILLYLVTETISGEKTESKDQVREHINRMNLMMTESGMPVLNPHSPFDYLILQAVNVTDDNEYPEFRLERMLHRVFHKKTNVAYIAETERRDPV